MIDKLKGFIDIQVPVDTCSLRCHYCYITQKHLFDSKLPKIKYTPGQVGKALARERLGGTYHINMCGNGETLLPPEMTGIVRAILEQGHYIMIVIAIILTAALNGKSAIHRLFKSRKWLIMGGVTFDLFLIHYPLIAAVSGTAKLLHLPAVYSHAAYIIILIPAAFIFKAIADRLRKTLASRHNPTQNQ